MQVKNRDPRYSTPESLAAADEWNAARIAVDELGERIAEHGIRDVPPAELAAAVVRQDKAVTALPIPEKLLRYDPADWPGREEPGFTSDAAHRRRQWSEACINWCIAHGIWSAHFEELAKAKTADPEQPKEKSHARTRRTSK